MKKLISIASATAIVALSATAFAACTLNTEQGGEGDKNPVELSVYAPDGAPALSLVNLIANGQSESYEYNVHVVQAATIQAQVTGEAPKADFCVLPVNAAANLLGSGETYKMLGTVTNGNMYFLTTGDNATVTSENLSALIGKTVGVVQLNNVPGLTFQSALKKADVPYQILGNDGTVDGEKVNLRAFQDASTVTPAAGCDYYLCPEPAVSTKLSKVAAFKLAGSLQEVYGGGYPQAVLVAKNSVISNHVEAVGEVITYMKGSGSYLENATVDNVLENLGKCYENSEFTPTFSTANLTATVIANCSVNFTQSKDCKTVVTTFLSELTAVNSSFAKAVSDSFFYVG